MVCFKIIACVDEKYGYSKLGKIPWHLDLKGKEMMHFKKQTTTGEFRNMLVMGYNTFNDMRTAPEDKCKKILETRDISVISSKGIEYDGIRVFKSVWDFLLYVHNNYKNSNDCNIWVCGGEDLWYYFLRLKIVNEILLSVVPCNYNCDKFFNINKFENQFNLIKEEDKDKFSIKYYEYMNKEECKYVNAIKKIMEKGYPSMDRSGVGTLSAFGKTFKYDIRNYRLPLFTHRKMFARGIIEELLFFISGKTDTKILENKGVNIWKTHTSASFLSKRGLDLKEGDYGPSYGYQLRNWGGKGLDQLEYVVNLLKTDPHSRRILFSYWNPEFLDKVPLPPCHILYMFNVNSEGELSCSFTQRSNDFALAGNFNICSATFLVFILCKVCNLKPGKIIHHIGNIHLYKNQLTHIKEFIDNKLYNFPLVDLEKKDNCDEYNIEDFKIMFYKSNKKYFIPISE